MGEGYTDAGHKPDLGEGFVPRTSIFRGERPLIRLRFREGTFSHKGRREEQHYTGVKNGSGGPSVVLNTTLTFCPIFRLFMSQSTKLVSSEGPSFSVT